MTDREIAQALFVTGKTVEMYLSRVFDKLDVRLRTALAGMLGNAAVTESSEARRA